MAKRKKTAAVAPRKRRRAPAAPAAKRRRSPARRKKGLSEGLRDALDMSTPTSPANLAIKGGLGGALSFLVTKAQPDPKKALTTNLILTGLAIMMKQGAIAAGIAGVAAAQYLATTGGKDLAEGEANNALFFDPAMLSEPDSLDAYGNPLLSDGSQFELSENIYPGYVPTSY